ncbi:MAG: hypothetical protein ABI574_12000 [Burkholderiales bacterium]
MPRTLLAFALLCLPLAVPAQQIKLSGDAPVLKPCPTPVGADVRCLQGRDHLGAWYWMAMPQAWNGTLVLHAHDGPDLGEPRPERGAEDLARWSAWLRSGYAWAGSGYRQGGMEVLAAGDDSERVRRAFVADFGEPKFTLLHGHGWGAAVAARMAERFTTPDIDPRRLRAAPSAAAADAARTPGDAMQRPQGAAAYLGKKPYDALLLTNGQLGGVRSLELALDIRVVYQAVCANLPGPKEPDYPLWMGLPLQAPPGTGPLPSAGSTALAPVGTDLGQLKSEDLAARVEACTGVAKPALQRTAAQQRALTTLTQVLRLPEAALVPQLDAATRQLADLVWRKLQGRNAIGNEGVRYRGSSDDDAFNARVPRYKPDPVARALLEADVLPTGRLHLPVLSLHSVHDPIDFVELESQWRTTLQDAAAQDNLLQVYLDQRDHSHVGDAHLLAAASALRQWADRGTRPAAADVAALCKPQGSSSCRILVDYQPAPVAERIAARPRPIPTAAQAPAVTTAASAPTPFSATQPLAPPTAPANPRTPLAPPPVYNPSLVSDGPVLPVNPPASAPR